MLSDVLEYPVEVPDKLALQLENFYISPSREKAPYYTTDTASLPLNWRLMLLASVVMFNFPTEKWNCVHYEIW